MLSLNLFNSNKLFVAVMLLFHAQIQLWDNSLKFEDYVSMDTFSWIHACFAIELILCI